MNKIRQFFCRHDYRFYKSEKVTFLALNPEERVMYVKLYSCSKCGKIKKESLVRREFQ